MTFTQRNSLSASTTFFALFALPQSIHGDDYFGATPFSPVVVAKHSEKARAGHFVIHITLPHDVPPGHEHNLTAGVYGVVGAAATKTTSMFNTTIRIRPRHKNSDVGGFVGR